MVTLWGRRAGTMGLGGLLLPLLVLGVAGSRLQLVTDLSSQALLGSGVLVKCRFDVGGPVDLSALRVQWYLFEERIAQYDQGRVESQIRGSLSEQELKTGDASLLLSSVTVSDEGPYKCVVGYGTEQLQGETTLRVLAAPRLSIPQRAAGTDTASSFPCHVWGFYPQDVTVTWLRDGRVLTDATRSAPQRNPDGTFNLTLTYTFTPTASDSGSIFSCHVSHMALAQPLREEFPLDVTGADHTSAAIGATLGILVAGGAAAAIAIYCWRKRREGRGAPYSVSEVLGPARCLLGQEVTLSCAMEGTFPKDTAVTWERIHGEDRTVIGTDGVSEAGEGSEHQPLLHPQPQRWRATQERSPCKERSGTCLAASLSFTPTVQDDGARVRCSFHHKSRGIREQRESGEIQLWARPQVSGIQVLPHWEPRDQVPFAVQLQNFYPRGIHRIQWSWDGKSWEKSEPTDYSENPDLTFSATSVWRIPSRELNRPGLRVRVSVQQSPQEPPIEREIRAEDTAPAVSEISKPESVTAGKEITLSCRMTGHFPGVLSVAWLRTQRSTTSARFEEKSKGDILVPLENSAEYRIEPGAPHTQDGKSFQQETRLSFTPSVQRDQGAKFICRVGHVTLEIPLERHTGELHVAEPPQAPVLREISRPQVLAPGEQVILSCYISRFYPKELSVTWHRRGRGESEFRCLDKPDTHKIVTPDPTAAPDRKSYFVMSQLYFSPMLPEDDGAEYRCSVEHETLQEPEGKSTGPLELRVPQAPVLREISRPQVLAPGEQVTLSCYISRFYPKELSVTWYRRGRGESEFRCLDKPDTHKIVTPDPTAAPDRKSYSVTSQLRLTPIVPEDDGAEYRCSVEHQTLQEPEGKSTGPLELRAQLQVSEIQVLPHWEPRDQVPFAVQIQNFYPRGIHRIQWSHDGAQSWRDETPEINQNPDLTFSATSVWRIPSRELNRPELRVRVFVQQRPRELPIKREIRAGDTGLLRPPEVSEISQPESVTAGEEITLSCRMTGHFPGALSVAWLRRGWGARAAVPLQGSAEYRIEDGAPDTQDGKSFQQETRLSFTHSVQRDQWAEYVCQVGHVALGTPLERCSRELQVTGRADSAPTKPSASENRSRDAEPASSPGAAAVTGPLVEERAGDTAPKGNAGGDGGAETKSENDTHKGTTTTQNDTAPATPAREQARDGADGPTPAKRGTTSDTSAREQARDGADGPTPAKRGTTSDTSAKERAGDNTADEDTTSDTSAREQAGDNTADESTTSDTSAREQARDGAASPTPAKGGTSSDTSAKERAGDNTADEDTTSDASAKEQAGADAADEDTTSELAEGGPGGARPAIGVVGDRVTSTTPVTEVAPDAVVSAPPAGGPEPNAEASATHGGDDADRAERVEEFGVDGTAGAYPGSSEQTA